MEFHGPEASDFANIFSLNQAYLRGLRNPGTAHAQLRHLSPVIAGRLAALDKRSRDWLSKAPFLLMSFHEHDLARWKRCFARERHRDLFATINRADDDLLRLLAAGVGFLWQLARRNPYAARVVSGATPDWCESLARCTLISIVEGVFEQSDLLAPRLARHPDFWDRLTGAGLSARPEVRFAAQSCALQTVLTRAEFSRYRRLPAAACKMPAPGTRIADT